MSCSCCYVQAISTHHHHHPPPHLPIHVHPPPSHPYNPTSYHTQAFLEKKETNKSPSKVDFDNNACWYTHTLPKQNKKTCFAQ